MLYHPVGDPEAQGAEAAGDEIGGVGLELDGRRLSGTGALETCDIALTSAKGDMVVRRRDERYRTRACETSSSVANRRQIDHSSPGFGVFEGERPFPGPRAAPVRVAGEEEPVRRGRRRGSLTRAWGRMRRWVCIKGDEMKQGGSKSRS